MYTVHFTIKGEPFPLFFGLLKNKKKATYKKLFGVILEELKIKNFNSFSIMGDFELINTGLFKMGNNIHFCYFHLLQCIVRRTRKISTTFLKDLFLLKDRLTAVCFLPPDRIKDCFIELEKTHTSPESLLLLQYFKTNFIDDKARYRINNWCVFGSSTRTNNTTESYHRLLSSFIKSTHPSLTFARVYFYS